MNGTTPEDLRRRFVEAAGQMTQTLGAGRVMGQVFAHIYFSRQPQSLDDLTRALGISKGSASMTVRQLEQWTALRQVWIKGERKDYYEASEHFGSVIRRALLDVIGRKMESGDFILTEAEQELIAGYSTEYSGMKFAMFYLAEFVNMFTVSAVAVTLFFGGWNGWAAVPSWIWFLGKTLVMVLLLMLFRWTYPRLRVDQLMEFAWKFLVPVTFANLIAAGVFKYLGWYW